MGTRIITYHCPKCGVDLARWDTESGSGGLGPPYMKCLCGNKIQLPWHKGRMEWILFTKRERIWYFVGANLLGLVFVAISGFIVWGLMQLGVVMNLMWVSALLAALYLLVAWLYPLLSIWSSKRRTSEDPFYVQELLQYYPERVSQFSH